MEMQVLAGGNRVTASILLQAAVNRGHNLLQTLDSISHIALGAFTPTLVLQEPDYRDCTHQSSSSSHELFARGDICTVRLVCIYIYIATYCGEQKKSNHSSIFLKR